MKKFVQTGVVRWAETDASGQFHNSAAMIWAEEAEHALCRKIAAELDLKRLPRRAVSISFLRPFAAGDSYTVKLWVTRIGNSSISYGWQILREKAVAIEGNHSVVYVSEDGRPQILPDNIRSALKDYAEG